MYCYENILINCCCYCDETDIVIARAMMRVLRGITVVFECILARVLRLRDGYMASTGCAMYS